jgi:uncharacterized protein YidB (DUF937 family)
MLDGLLKNLNLGDKNGALLQLIAGQMQNGGGLEGLLSKFGAAGLGDKAASWVSTGENQPISPEEAKAALGPEFISDAAQRLGVSEDEVSQATSQALPEVVDKLTPEGQVPQGLDAMGALQGLMGGQAGGFDLGQVGGMLGGLLGGDKKS